MSGFNWARSRVSGQPWGPAYQLLGSVPRGSTLRTIRFSWGFFGFTSQTANVLNALGNGQVLGICTVVGNGSEAPPNPVTDPNNQDPPTERWLWWEYRAPQVQTYSDSADAVWYRDTPLGEPTNVQSMVSAAGIAEGDALGVFASWAPTGSWDSSGTAELWVAMSIGYTTSA
jgi:hypothetical protein